MIEDSEDDSELLRHELEKAGYRLESERVDSPLALAAALRRQTWDIVLSDFSMPQFSGMEALKIVREHDPNVPFIIVSGTIGEERAVQLMKSGAQDYVLKGHVKRLLPAVERELKEAEMRRAHLRAEERIRRLAYYDAVTELPNRTHFLEKLAARLDPQRAKPEPVAVLAAQLISYDEINTTLGYSIGDALLQRAGERLRQLLPAGNTVSTPGTARFAAILAPGDGDLAHAVAESIQREFARPFDIAGFRLTPGIRVGAAQFPDHGDDAQLLLRRAEMALVLARRNPSGFAAYSPETDPSSPERLALATELREALATRSLRLHYQPKINLVTGRPEGAEALTRWTHPEKGIISPNQFIPIAERAGLINPLTHWMLEAAVEQQQLWLADGGLGMIPVAINLSVRNLLDRSLIGRFQGLLRDRQLLARAIEVEITESALMEDPDHSLRTLEQLRELGVRIYIDDFGTGYSSLSYLKRLPIDAVKIDQSFIKDMTRNPDSASIVSSTIDLAHNLGLRVVAEGVEDRATLEQLTSLACDSAQGYFVSHPMAAGNLSRWYKDFRPLLAA
jgi:diguanylate cyclase (GGDEF)-like protein